MNTLVVGNTGYWTAKTLKLAFGDSHIVVVGTNTVVEKESGITCFPISISDERFESLFINYAFERVVYLSGYLTLRGSIQPEIEDLRILLRLCKVVQTEQIVFLASQEICADQESGKHIILQSEESLCQYYIEKYWLTIKIIRTPFLCYGRNPEDYFYRLFRMMEEKKHITISESHEQKTNFISMEDLAEFLFRLFDAWDGNAETLNLFGYTKTTFADIENWIKEHDTEVSITQGKSSSYYEVDLGDNVIRSRYGWFASKEVVKDLDSVYEDYQRVTRKNLTFLERVREKLLSLNKGVLLIELFAGCIATEFLNHFLSASPQFSSIDVRLLFVVLMASVYGMNAGMAAAFLETLAIGYTYMEAGLNWQVLFYEPSNWIPFILYFTVGAVCGYVKYRNDDTMDFLKKENSLVLDKLSFTNSLYKEALVNKSEYKKQIITRRDSFGKIFEVVRHLDTVVPQEIYGEAIDIMEDVLDNHSIAIYSLRKSGAIFGRLEVSSRSMEEALPKSIRLSDYKEAMKPLEEGEIWINTALLPGYPMYMAGLKEEGDIILLIMIYRAGYDQMGMYYGNLFRVICGLIENSFVKAWKYEEAVRDKVYIEDTIIAKEDYFTQQLRLRHDMAENGISTYALVRISTEGKSAKEMDELLRTKVRETDLLGMGGDGNLYLLLAQADNNSVGIVLDRISSMGITCKQIDQVSGDAEDA